MPKTIDKTIEAINSQVQEFQNILKGVVPKEDFDALTEQVAELKTLLDDKDAADRYDKISDAIKSINEHNGKLHDAILKLEEDKLEAKAAGTKAARRQALETDVKAFSAKLFHEDGSKNRGASATLEVKAAEEFGYPQTFVEGTETSAYTGRVVDPVLYARRRKTNIILDHFRIETINAPELIYLRKIEEGAEGSADAGSAAWIACGQAKPRRSFRLATGTAKAKKVAVFTTVDDCIIQDVPSLINWINTDFNEELDEAINDGFLNGDTEVDPLQPNGIKKYAVLFSPTAAFTEKVKDANEIDAIFAIAARMRTDRENAAAIYVAWDTYYRIMSLKDNGGQYQNNNLVYVDSLGNLYIAGVQVVGVDSEDVNDTHFLAISSDPGFKIRAYGNRAIETGLNGEDFREDKTSLRGYQRFLSYLPEERQNGIMYDTWDNVITAIEAPEQGGEGA